MPKIKGFAGLLEYFLIRDADIVDIAMGDSGRAGGYLLRMYDISLVK